jgi:hypothetical protein
MTSRRLTGAWLSGVVLTIAGAASVTVCLASASGGFRDVSLGLRPAAATGASSGWLFTGGMFWLMALGGLIPLLAGLVGDLRPGGRPEPTYLGPGGLAYYGPREVAHLGARALVRTGAGRIGMWLIGSVAGTGLGLAATSGLIGVLR